MRKDEAVNPDDPLVAQRVVGEYAALLEQHAATGLHPGSIAMLPYTKDTIKASIRTVLLTLKASGQLTEELREFLEVSYTSLAEYVDEEVAALMAEYRQASGALSANGRRGQQQFDAPAWNTVAAASRLVGAVARAMTADGEALREEFDLLAR